MATQTAEVEVKIGNGQAITSMRELKKVLKDAQFEALAMSEAFGATSTQAVNAAKKVGELKDKIGDAKQFTDAFNPDAKFTAMAGAIQGVVGGFSAVTGAMALFGTKNEEVEKTLVKVQGAMAMSQGLNSVLAARDSFKIFAAQLMQFQVVQKLVTAGQWLWNIAMEANPIGAIILAITLLIAAGAALIAFFISSAEESKKNEEAIKANSKALEAQKVAAQASANQLEKNQAQQLALAKANGATTASIRALESKLIDEKIAYVNSSKEAAKNTYEKNKNALANLKVSGASDELIDAQRKVTNDSVTEYNKQIENSYKANEEKKDLENKHIVEIAAEKTKANEKALEKQKEHDTKLLAKNKEYQDKLKAQNKTYHDEINKLEEENYLSTVKDENARAILKIQLDFENDRARINKSVAGEQEKKDLIAQLEIKAQNDIDAYQQAAFDKEQEKTNKKNEERIKKLNDHNQKVFDAKQKSLTDQAAVDLTASANNKLSFDERLAAIADREQKEKDIVFASAEERTAYEKANADARVAIGEAESEAKKTQMAQMGNALMAMADLAGKSTGAGKALAIAATTISTYQNAVSAYSSAFKPVATQASPILGAVYAGIAVAQGIANVKKILSVKVPSGGGGGGGVPSPSAVQAPVMPTLGSTALNQQMTNNLSSATTRAFVLESDVSNGQERIQRLNRAARIN